MTVHIAATMEGDKGAHIPQTMERQHGGLVLSVDALTKDCLHDIPCHSSFPRALNLLKCTYNHIIAHS